MMFPSTVRDPRRPARREGRGRLRPLGRLHGLHVRARAGLRDDRGGPRRGGRSWSAATCSRASSTGATARPSSSSGTAPARSCSSRSEEPASSRSSSAPTARAASTSGCRAAARACSRIPSEFVKMNGREVFKFATRVLVSVGRGRARRGTGRPSRMSTSTSRIRRTFASSITQPRSSGFRRIGW